MYCKFCGKQIDRKTMRCVNCGEPVGSFEGGVGFWDLAGERMARENYREPSANDRKIEKDIEQIMSRQDRQDKKISILFFIVIGTLAISLAFNIVLIGITRNLGKDYENLVRNYQDQFEQENTECVLNDVWDTLPEDETFDGNEQNPTNENTGDTLPGNKLDGENQQDTHTESLDSTLPETETSGGSEDNSADGQTEPILITKQPTDETVTKEAVGKDIFRLEAEGEELQFRWQKYDGPPDTWIDIDENLLVEVPLDNFKGTTLQLKLWSELIYGKYRCVITDVFGNSRYSNEVEIKP